MNKEEKLKDCLVCICLKCMKDFKTNPRTCRHSICSMCEMELGAYLRNCRGYSEKKEARHKIQSLAT